jgi:hypothetical protein
MARASSQRASFHFRTNIRRGEHLPTEVQRLVESVERTRAILLASVAELSDIQGGFKASADEWRIVEILEHLYLAELGGITKTWSALNDVRAGRLWSGPLPHRGKSIEEVIAATWKPKEVAPSTATPRFGGPLAAWRTAFRHLPSLLQDLADELEGQRLEDIVFPHLISGPLDARQRLEFLRFHIERHTAQVQHVRSSTGFPASVGP